MLDRNAIKKGQKYLLNGVNMKGLFLVLALIAACVAFILTGHRDASSWAALAAAFIVMVGGLES